MTRTIVVLAALLLSACGSGNDNSSDLGGVGGGSGSQTVGSTTTGPASPSLSSPSVTP
jgi:hypothetical protein